METSSGKTSEYSSEIVEEGKVKYVPAKQLSSVPRGLPFIAVGRYEDAYKRGQQPLSVDL